MALQPRHKEVGLGRRVGLIPIPCPCSLLRTSWVGEVAKEVMETLQLPSALLSSIRMPKSLAASQRERIRVKEEGWWWLGQVGTRELVRGETDCRPVVQMGWCPEAQGPACWGTDPRGLPQKELSQSRK